MTNMYEWTSGDQGETWNPIAGGPCPHACGYCYVDDMKNNKLIGTGITKKYSGPLRLHNDIKKKKFKSNVFVCSMTDLFCNEMPESFIQAVLDKMKLHPDIRFFLQTKNPEKLAQWIHEIPDGTYIVTTIESNRNYKNCKAPPVSERAEVLRQIGSRSTIKTSVTIEPIMKFDLREFVELIILANPSFVAIGADSKGHNLEEPTSSEVLLLIDELESAHIEVKLKDNIFRILPRRLI